MSRADELTAVQETALMLALMRELGPALFEALQRTGTSRESLRTLAYLATMTDEELHAVMTHAAAVLMPRLTAALVLPKLARSAA